MKSNRQFFILVFIAWSAIAVHGQYGTFYVVPDFSTALPVSEMEASDVQPLADGISWRAARLLNWTEFFREGEEVETSFYYQSTLPDARLFLMLETPISNFEEMYWSLEFVGNFYLVTETDEVKLITKFVRQESGGHCQYQKVEHFDQLPTTAVVSFEPPEFTNLIQTNPQHLQKQFADLGYISANLTKEMDSWIVNLWSEEVTILELVKLEDYYSSELETQLVGDSLRIHIMDVATIENVVNLQEEMVFELRIQE